MKVLFVTDDDLTKSVVYDIHVLAEGLSLLGHNVYVIDCKRDKPNWFRTIKQDMARVYPDAQVHMFRYTMLTFPIFTEKFRSFVWKFLYAFSSCYKLASKVLKKNDIDVIVIYSVINSGLSMIHLGRKFNIPVVFRNIDMLHRLNANSMIRSVVAFFELMVYPRVDKILALTPKYAEYLITMGGQNSTIEILPFPVEVHVLDAHPSRLDSNFPEVCQRWLDEKKQIIVFVGHLYNFSGLAEFIREFPEVIRQTPDARLLLVGDGPMRGELETIISGLKLEEHVFITGLQPFKTMPQYIGMATVCINAYPVSGDMKDLFAAKVIQYLACGKATVSSALPGMTTMLAGESCGVVYVDDAVAMAREIVSLFKSPERRERLGRAGLDYVRRVHSRERVILKLEELLKESIEKKLIKKLGRNFAHLLFRSMRNKSYENHLYNSANNGYIYYRAGQRINHISAGAVVNQVKVYMDKVGNPTGTGSCVVRKVSDDSIVGTFGTIDISTLPATPAIVFEWNATGGDSSNYPRVRYNNTDTIGGVFTYYSSEGKWADASNWDTSIKMLFKR
jgi:glycosyltransferase involved in cell wall biosynthesis